VTQCAWPVLGIQIGRHSSLNDAGFDKTVTSRSRDIDADVRELIQEVMF